MLQDKSPRQARRVIQLGQRDFVALCRLLIQLYLGLDLDAVGAKERLLFKPDLDDIIC